jgi:MFS family permease
MDTGGIASQSRTGLLAKGIAEKFGMKPSPESSVLIPIFLSRVTRLFAYGGLAVVLVMYLDSLGWKQEAIGLLLTATLIGDTVLTLAITSVADHYGRRKMLLLGGLLMTLAGAGFLVSREPFFLFVFAVLGIISPSGGEVGPFLALEQSILAQAIEPSHRTRFFSWYNLAGFLAMALGSLCGGAGVQALIRHGFSAQAGYQFVMGGYALLGLVLAGFAWKLPSSVENTHRIPGSPLGIRWRFRLASGLDGSRKKVYQLSGLLALDAFGSGFVVQSLLAYWLHVRFAMDPAQLGSLFFAANLLSGISALLSHRVSRRIGLLNVMVFTHLPCNVLFLLIPLMPTRDLAIALLLIRFAITQVDVPARQAYLMALVRPHERSAASGLTAVARTLGLSLSPMLAGPMMAHPNRMAWPFFFAGGCKILFDFLLLWIFHGVPLEEGAT